LRLEFGPKLFLVSKEVGNREPCATVVVSFFPFRLLLSTNNFSSIETSVCCVEPARELTLLKISLCIFIFRYRKACAPGS
jgi:hypothetical protein